MGPLNLFRCAKIFCASAILAACGTLSSAPLATVPSVDLDRYLGNWYEVAMLPNRFQRMCVADTQANYRLADSLTGDSLRVLNRCRKSDGSLEVAQGVARAVEGSKNAKLRVSFFRPFYGDYWLLALGSNYEWALVGEESREYAWVLSRTPKLDEATLNSILDKAASLGFKREQFVRTPQTQPLN